MTVTATSWPITTDYGVDATAAWLIGGPLVDGRSGLLPHQATAVAPALKTS